MKIAVCDDDPKAVEIFDRYAAAAPVGKGRKLSWNDKSEFFFWLRQKPLQS